MSDQTDRGLREIERALAIEPSARFVNAVRARTIDAPRRSTFRWWMGVAALAAAAGLAVVVWTHRERASPPAAASAAIAPPVTPPAAGLMTEHDPRRPAAEAPDLAEPSAPPMRAAESPTRSAGGGARHLAAVPVALVPAEQRIVFQRLLASLKQGGVMPVAFDFAPNGEVTPLAEPAPISIPAIDIPAIDIGSTGLRGDNQ